MSSNRNIGLDYLRSLAIIIVLFNHALIGFFFSTSIIKYDGVIGSISSSTIISIEWLFVLSGFLIGTMMIRSFSSEKNWLQCARDFWLRRWFRTIPNYYLFVVVNSVLVVTGIASGDINFAHLVFSQNLIRAEQTPLFFSEAWSLALDEWFYLIMPIIIGGFFVFSKNRKYAFIFASCVLIVLPVLARMLHSTPTDFLAWDSEIRRITIYHLDATGWGVLAAVINKWQPDWWKKNTVWKAFSGLLLMFIGLFFVVGLVNPDWMNSYFYRIGNIFSITLMSLGTFLVIPWMTSIRTSWKPTDWIIAKLSAYSYSIYLVHFPLIFIIKYIFVFDAQQPLVYIAALVALWFSLVFVCSGLIFTFFEKPIADLRESFTKRVDASPF